MAYPSVTHTLANDTTANATHLNTNFSDVISGITDGTKDLNINQLTLNSGVSGSIYDPMANAGSGVVACYPVQDSSDMQNVGLTVAMAANAVTITLTQADGTTAPSTTSPVIISFRSSTLTTGAIVRRACTSSINTVISSGSTAGQADGATYPIYIYAIDNAGTIELAWSRLYFKSETELVSTTAEGGAGGADAAGTMYSTTARTNVPFRLIGRFVSTQTTAGTWAAAATEVSVGNKTTIEYEPIIARYDTDAGQSISHNTDTIVDFDSITFGYDSHNCVTTGAAWKFTSLKDAYYSVKAHIRYVSAAWVANEYNYLTLYRDAGAVAYLQQDRCRANVTQEMESKGATSIYIAKDSYIDVRAYQYTGVAVALTTSEESNYISIEEIN